MHFPHLSLVDDWLEEGVVMEVGRQPEQPPVSEEAIIECTHILDFESVSTCFSTEVPSSRIHYNKGITANMPIYVQFLLIGMTKILKC